jgi:hypothetical protein
MVETDVVSEMLKVLMFATDAAGCPERLLSHYMTILTGLRV